MKTKPLVSVIMPVYNSEKYLKESIESILNQTYKNFEFIIIDDGSTDNSWNIILNYANTDTRINPIKNNKNLKICETLNKGINLSKGKYIIRMDSDDVSFTNRIEKQVKFMESNENIGVLGTGWVNFNENIIKGNSYGVLDGLSPVHHPTIIVKKNIYEKYGLYKLNYEKAEGTELWFDWFSKGIELLNLNEPLLYYRIHSNSISNKNKLKQMILLNKVFIKGFFIYNIRYNLKGYLTFLDRCFYIIILFLKIDRIINKEKIKRLFK